MIEISLGTVTLLGGGFFAGGMIVAFVLLFLISH